MPRTINENIGEHAHHFQGGPKWHQQLLESILKEAHALSAEGYKKYGALSPEQQTKVEVLKKRYQQLQDSQKENGSLSFSVKPDLEPFNFFAKDLGLLKTNDDFAKHVLYEATGEIPNKKDIKNLQNRIQAQFPNLNELRARELQQQTLAKKAFNPGYTPDLEKKQRQLKKWEDKKDALSNKDWEDIRDGILSLEQEQNGTARIASSYPLRGHAKEVISHLSGGVKYRPSQIIDLLKNAENEILKKNPDSLDLINEKIAKKIGQIAEIENHINKIYDSPDKIRNTQIEIQRELKKFASQGERIAPLNKTHDRVSDLIDSGLNDDTINVSNEEIKAAKNGSISASLKPYLDKATDISESDVTRYKNSYQKNVIDALRDETKENLLEKIIPNINISFGAKGMGSFHSGARASAIKSAVEKKERDLKKEISKLLHAGEMEAQKHAKDDKDRYLQAAQLESGATKAEKEESRANASELRQNALIKKNMHHLDLAALSQEAALRQKQEQNKIDTNLAMFKEEEANPRTKLDWEATLVRGLPVAQQQFASQSMGQPTPPNPYNVAGGLAGALFGGIQKNARGGSVRSRYAKGGAINRWKEIGESVQADDYEKEAAEIAREFRHYKGSPNTNWASHVGAAMLSNVRGDPLDNLGAGNLSYMEAKQKDHEQSLTSKEKAANLFNKMAESRLEQHKVLAAYENKLAELAETSRHNLSSEGIARSQLDDKKEKEKLQALQKLLEQQANINPKTGLPYTWLEKAEMKAEIDEKLRYNSPAAQSAASKLDDSQTWIGGRVWNNIFGKSAPKAASHKSASGVSSLSDAEIDARLAAYG